MVKGSNSPGRLAEAPETTFETSRDKLVERSGGVLTLQDASARLGITEQALHKRIHANSALGMMIGDRIVVPALQMTTAGGKTRILAGVDKVTKAFVEAGASGWGALQFLVDPDPNLEGQTPVDMLREGRVQEVVQAARACLGLDEG
jgi:hypothetical protein